MIPNTPGGGIGQLISWQTFLTKKMGSEALGKLPLQYVFVTLLKPSHY
jgi:hypothetical protein